MILVISSKNSYVAKRLIAEAKKVKQGIAVMPANKLSSVNQQNYDCLYIRSPYIKGSPQYIPDVIKLAKRFKKAGKKVVDASIAAGHLGEGKWVDYQRLIKAGLPIPKTAILSRSTIPKSWPFILKWFYGFKGKHTYFIQNQKQFDAIFAKYPRRELLVQEFISAEFEYKVVTVGYKALPVVLRFAVDPITHRPDFNRFKIIQSKAAGKPIKIAEKAAQILKRELSKVDILESKGKLYILEVNRFPGLDSFEKLTKHNACKEFLEYLQE